MRDLTDLFEAYLRYFRLKDKNTANCYDKYTAISCSLRTKITDNWLATQKKYLNENQKSVYYISLEYNLGSPIKMHTSAAGLEKEYESLKKYAAFSDEDLLKSEPSVELGNNLLGDFAGNVLETLASKGIVSVAYGLWYDLAQFKQSKNSHTLQIEEPYYWTSMPHPWSLEDCESKHSVYFGGTIKPMDSGKEYWDFKDVITATAFDYPLSGYRNEFANTLRFWKATPSSRFNEDYTNHGDYIRACDDKMNSIRFSRYLFNDEAFRQTSELHIQQQYFLASASIKDIIYRHKVLQGNPIASIAEKVQIILADCRCGFAIIELLSALIYDYDVPIAEALKIAEKVFIVSIPLSDNMEFLNIPLYIFEAILPFHFKVVEKVNQLILDKARDDYGISDDEAREISLIEEGAMKKVRMANLLLLFSRKVLTFSENDAKHINDLVCPNTLRFFNVDISPAFSAVSIRRWLYYTNGSLAKLVSSKIGSEWISDNGQIAKFEKFTNDISVQNEFEKIKLAAKKKFFKSRKIYFSDEFLSEALFIAHSRRITMANSQILMLFYIACRYIRLGEGENLVPRVYLFAGRASPADFYGKQLFALMKIFTRVLEAHPKLQVYFTLNRNASTDESFLTAGDVSEYISSPLTLEAPAFNIFRCAANGIITLTGANKSEVQTALKLGEKTTFSFGNPDADPNDYDINYVIERNPIIQKAFDLIYKWVKDCAGGEEEERKIYPLLQNLRSRDEMKMFLHFEEYCWVQDEIDAAYQNKSKWLAMALRNISRAGAGSIDDAVLSLFVNEEKERYKKW